MNKAPEVEDRLAFVGIHHVAVVCQDLEQSLLFYHNVLGASMGGISSSSSMLELKRLAMLGPFSNVSCLLL